jgi:hypothetical protein
MATKKIPLIHVGYPKALSSWLQKFLFTPRNGFCKVLDPLVTQLFVIDATPFTFNPDQARAWMEKERQGHAGDDLQEVITSESLVGHTHCGGYNAKTNADRLKILCPEAKILIVVREQRAMIRSLYKTWIVWGMPHSIDRILHPLEPGLSPQFNLDFLRYDLLVDYYQKLYGKENVLVLPYELFEADALDFIHKIFAHVGMSMTTEQQDHLPVKRKVNRGQTLLNLLIERWRNMFFLSSPFNYAGLFNSTENNLKKRIIRSKRNIFPAFMNRWFEKGFEQKVRDRCRGEFAQSNQRLTELTGLDLSVYGYEL